MRPQPSRLRTFVALPLLLLLAACGGSASQLASEAPARLTGMSKGDLLACAGRPDRTRIDGGRELLVYETTDAIGADEGVFTDSTRTGSGLSVPFTQQLSSDFCEASFVLRDGRVESLTYRGPSTSRIGRPFGACYALVQGCLRSRPQAGDPIVGAPTDEEPAG